MKTLDHRVFCFFLDDLDTTFSVFAHGRLRWTCWTRSEPRAKEATSRSGLATTPPPPSSPRLRELGTWWGKRIQFFKSALPHFQLQTNGPFCGSWCFRTKLCSCISVWPPAHPWRDDARPAQPTPSRHSGAGAGRLDGQPQVSAAAKAVRLHFLFCPKWTCGSAGTEFWPLTTTCWASLTCGLSAGPQCSLQTLRMLSTCTPGWSL